MSVLWIRKNIDLKSNKMYKMSMILLESFYLFLTFRNPPSKNFLVILSKQIVRNLMKPKKFIVIINRAFHLKLSA